MPQQNSKNDEQVIEYLERYQSALVNTSNSEYISENKDDLFILDFIMTLNQQLIDYLKFLHKHRSWYNTMGLILDDISKTFFQQLQKDTKLPPHERIKAIYHEMDRKSNEIYAQRHSYLLTSAMFFTPGIIICGGLLTPAILLLLSPSAPAIIAIFALIVMVCLAGPFIAQSLDCLDVYNHLVRHHQHWTDKLKGEHSKQFDDNETPCKLEKPEKQLLYLNFFGNDNHTARLQIKVQREFARLAPSHPKI